MATYDVSTITSLLKETYADQLVEWYKTNHVLFQLLMQGDKSAIGGKHLRIPIRLTRQPGGSPGGELSAYPGATKSSFGEFQVNWTFYRNQFEVTAKAQLDSRDPSMAFLKGLEVALEDAVKGIKTAEARDLYGTRNAALSVAASTAGATVTVRDAYSTSEDDLRGTRYLMPGMRVHVIDPATGTFRVNAGGSNVFTVSSITNTTVVVLDAEPLALAGGDILVPENSWDAGGTYGNAIYGLGEIVDNGAAPYSVLWGSYGGLDRSTVPQLNSVVKSMAAAALTEADLDECFDAVYGNCGEQLTPENCILIAHPSVVRVMKGWKYSDIRYMPTEAKLGIDDKNFSYNSGTGNIGIFSDRMAIPRCLYGINKGAVQVYEVTPIELAQDMQVKQSGTSYYDIYVGLLHTGLQMFSDRPHSHFKVVNIGSTDPEAGHLYARRKPE
jgi:hypothetical protein